MSSGFLLEIRLGPRTSVYHDQLFPSLCALSSPGRPGHCLADAAYFGSSTLSGELISLAAGVSFENYTLSASRLQSQPARSDYKPQRKII